MNITPKSEPSPDGCMLSLSGSDCSTATDLGSYVPGRAAQQTGQSADPSPIMLYPICINKPLSPSPVFDTRETIFKVPHGGGGEEVQQRSTLGLQGSSEAVSTSSEFTHRAIVLLIEAMHRRWDVYGSRERSRLFQSVQEELESLGHALPVERIRRKWNNLIVTYKRVKDRCRGSGQAKTSWEYFEMMDDMLGKTRIAQSSPASATLLGLATTAKAAAMSEECPSSGVSVAAVAASCLFPSGLAASSAQIPTLAPPSLLYTIAQKTTPRQSCGADPSLPSVSLPSVSLPSISLPSLSLPSLSPKPAAAASHPPLRRRLRHHPPAAAAFLAQQHGQAEKRTALLRSFLTGQEEQARLEEQRQSRAEARERRRERTAGRVADALGRMATALELISSKQDTIIALLQRLADKH